MRIDIEPLSTDITPLQLASACFQLETLVAIDIDPLSIDIASLPIDIAPASIDIASVSIAAASGDSHHPDVN